MRPLHITDFDELRATGHAFVGLDPVSARTIDAKVQDITRRYWDAVGRRPAIARMFDASISGLNRLHIPSFFLFDPMRAVPGKRTLWARPGWPAQIAFWSALSFDPSLICRPWDIPEPISSGQPKGSGNEWTPLGQVLIGIPDPSDAQPTIDLLKSSRQRGSPQLARCVQALLTVTDDATLMSLATDVDGFSEQARRGFGI